MRRIYLALTLCMMFLSVLSQDYPKAILPGDYPDPTILRDGADYYMTHSPMVYKPGFLIWHSKDLVNWEPVNRIVPDYEGSAWAPDLVKHDGRYYLYYPTADSNWVTWADDIRGPWSNPIDLKVSGIDPGHIADADGNRYLFVNTGEVIRLSPDGLSTIGEKIRVYDGWDYPDDWKTEGKFLESPKMTYHDGYYYLTSAEGGTAGPPTSHMVVSARSKDIMGPWENSPYNPIVHTYGEEEPWWSKGHGTIVDDVNGNWWIVYHAYANGYHTLGRSTLLEPIEWTEDGWYRTIADAELPKSDPNIEHGLELSDDFSMPSLGLQWTAWMENAKDIVEIGDNKLKVKGKGESPADGRLLLVTPQHKTYEAMAEVSVGDQNMSGLLLFYSEGAYAGLVSDGKILRVYSNPEQYNDIKSSFGKNFFVKLRNNCNLLTISLSGDGERWETIAENIDVSSLHHNNYNGFLALRPALCVTGKGTSEFKNFKYLFE